VAVRRRGITSKRIGRNEPAYANAYSLLSRKARQHEAVAAVIAATTNDMPAPGFRPGTPGELQRRRRRALHQGVAGYTGHSDGIAVHAAHAFGGIYLDGELQIGNLQPIILVPRTSPREDVR